MNHHSTYKSSFCVPTSLTVIRSLKLKSFHKGRICGQINILRDLTKQRGTNATPRLYKANVYPYIVKTEKDKTKVGGGRGDLNVIYFGIEISQHFTAAGLICNLEDNNVMEELGATGDSGSREVVKVNVVQFVCVNGRAVRKPWSS